MKRGDPSPFVIHNIPHPVLIRAHRETECSPVGSPEDCSQRCGQGSVTCCRPYPCEPIKCRPRLTPETELLSTMGPRAWHFNRFLRPRPCCRSGTPLTTDSVGSSGLGWPEGAGWSCEPSGRTPGYSHPLSSLPPSCPQPRHSWASNNAVAATVPILCTGLFLYGPLQPLAARAGRPWERPHFPLGRNCGFEGRSYLPASGRPQT